MPPLLAAAVSTYLDQALTKVGSTYYVLTHYYVTYSTSRGLARSYYALTYLLIYVTCNVTYHVTYHVPYLEQLEKHRRIAAAAERQLTGMEGLGAR